ncbi:MAG: SPOR domain-containing protein [Cyclobacteriaceae bacterium]|nr:SPOR domain-containing protein [Cyclobacteriaceae bacterium]
MMRTQNKFALIGLLYLLGGCASQQISDKPYHENLASLRPTVTVSVDTPNKDNSIQKKQVETITPTQTVNAKVDAVLDSINRYNLVKRFVDGYTIQIYSGQNREDAMNIKKKMSTEIGDLTANLQYQQPKFTVTVGRYYTKLEAQKDLVQIRKSFTSAILVPEKIAIR